MPHIIEIALVPSISDLDDKWGLRKEALRSLDATEKEAQLSAAFDEVLAALGKRAKRPVTFVDDWIKALVCRIASANLLGWRRGRGGQDTWIDAAIADIEKDLEDIRLGRVEPYFTDSTPMLDEQGPRGGGDVTADAWAKCNPWPWFPGNGGC